MNTSSVNGLDRRVWPVLVVLALTACGTAAAQGVLQPALPGKNVNAIGPAYPNWLYTGDPRLQNNEADGACSPNNPDWCAIGMNDYRGVNDPALGDTWQGIAMTRDGGRSWFSGLTPAHLGDTPNIGQKFAADPNLEAVPGMLFFNFIAGWRDDSNPGGVYLQRWYEHNREVGPPWQNKDTLPIELGTKSGIFIDKPAFLVTYKAASEPDIVVPIPALPDPANPAQNLHEAYDLILPAIRLHQCYAVFVGNDNNDGTKIECRYSDDAGVTWSNKSKLTESREINQGVSLAARNNGQEMLATWLQFKDDVNDSDAIMYAYSSDGGETWSSPTQLTEFCPFNQPTGPARHRTNALPVTVSNGDDFAVYFASRNTPTGRDDTCILPAKGNNDPVVVMENVAIADDHDSFNELRDADGNRIRDGLVRRSLNYSRIMMVRSANPAQANSWSEVVAVDPQLRSDVPECQGAGVECRRNGHQYMPAAFAAKGVETVAWYDSRLDRLNRLANPITSGFVGDVIAAFKSDVTDPETGKFLPPWTNVTLLPADVYELEPPPAAVPPPGNNIPLRRNIDVFAVQIARTTDGSYEPLQYLVNPETYYPDATATQPSPSVRVTRFATRLERDELGNIIRDPLTGKPMREQAEYDFPNARMFRQGRRPFIGDYNTVFGINARLENGEWVSNQSAIDTSAIGPDSPVFFAAREPKFHIGWTTNKDVRGKVFYTGCDEWDEAEQRWKPSDNCASEYVVPGVQQGRVGTMLPLQGEDATPATPPGQCVALGSASALEGAFKGPLTRNQNIYTAVMRPGLSVDVVSAIKDRDATGSVLNTYVIAVQNATRLPKKVRIVLPESDPTVSFDKATFESNAPKIGTIDVAVPAGFSNVRTAFDSAGDLQTPVPVIVYDVTGLAPGTEPGPADIIARVALERDTVLPLEPVVSDTFGDNIIDLEYFEVLLSRETGAEKTLDFENLDFENLDFENDPQLLDFENSAELLDFENLDFENTLLFLDFENTTISNADLLNDAYSLLDFENLDFENTVTLLDFENLDFENRTMLLDFENLDFENRFLEALDFENLDFENLDFENLDFENNTQLLDFENLDFENLDFENSPLFASEVKNQDLETLDLDAPLNQESVEVTWAATSESNTTTGVDIKPIFSPALVQALEDTGSKVILSVRQAYYTSTVSLTSESNFCTVQVVADNQILYSAVLTPSQINSLFDDPAASEIDTPAFRIDPDGRVFITLQIVNPPAQFSTAGELDPAIGLGIYAQGLGNTQPCVENQEVDGTVDYESCDIDPFEQDQEPPVITLLGDDPDTAEATQAAGAVYTDPGFTASDDFDGDVTNGVVVTGNVDLSAPGSYTLTYTVSDAFGNQTVATRTVNVVDTTPPTITAPADVTTEALAPLTSVAIGDAIAADNSGSVSVTNDAATNFPSGFPVGISTVTWTASDGARTATDTQTVVVTDTSAPSIILNTVDVGGSPAIDYTLEAGEVYSEPGAIVADLADPSPLLIISGSVDTATVGNYVITYTATDATATLADGTPAPAPNTTIVTRTITVIDTTDPTITTAVPPPLTPDPATAIIVPPDTTLLISWPITATDEGSSLTLSCTIDGTTTLDAASSSYDAATGILEASFEYDFPAGTTVVNCTATDQSGLTVSTGDFPVFVEDEPIIDETTLPTLPLLIEADDVTGYAGATPWSPVLADDGVDGDNSLTAVCTPSTGFVLGDNLVTCIATDSAGNPSAEVTFTVTVVDTTPPVITSVQPDITLEANGPTGFANSGSLWAPILADDVYDGQLEALCTPSSTSDFGFGTTPVTCVARDSNNNPDATLNPGDPGFPSQSFTTFDVTVQDTTPPVIDPAALPDPTPTMADALEGNALGGYDAAAAPLWIDPVPNAALDIVDGSLNVGCSSADGRGPASSYPLGATDINCSVSDSNIPANTATIAPAFTIYVGDETPPAVTISVTGDPVEATGPGGASVPFDTNATDIVSGPLPTTCTVAGQPVSSPHLFPPGTSTLTCTAIDGSGVQGSATASVTVEDTTAPAITTTPLVVVTDGTFASIAQSDIEARVSASDIVDGDNLTGNVTVSCPIAPDPADFPLGTTPVSCTATDTSGNAASADVEVTVQFAYDIVIKEPKGNIQAGSSLPIDWYYTQPGTNVRVDTAGLMPLVEWFGPFPTSADCSTGATGTSDGSTAADDTGSSDIRYSSSDQSWRLNWDTPAEQNYYRVVITPPGTDDGTICVRLK